MTNKRVWVQKKKMKLTSWQSLSIYLILKRISCMQWLLWVVYPNRLACGAYFLLDFSVKMFLIWYSINEKSFNVAPFHSVHWGIKNTPFSLTPPPLKSANCPRKAPFLCIFKFFIYEPIPPFKRTKFLVKISQFKFLVKTEKNIFCQYFKF